MTLLTGRNRIYLLLATAAIAALLTVACAATTGAQEATPTPDAVPAATDVPAGTVMMEASGSDSHPGLPYDGPSGVWVSGHGKASGAPDIAILSVGVESIEDSATIARANAATAMNSVTSVLTEAGIAESDIQTREYNISPRYRSVEVQRCDNDGESGELKQEGTADESCYKVWESQLIGYSVSNQAAVTIRNLDSLGTIIDSASESAGNLVHVNGITFGIEDLQPLQDEARAEAVADMKRKAEMLAELSGVKLGRLVYLSEGASHVPMQQAYARAEAAFATDAATSISPGELDVSVAVQGVFLIAENAGGEEE